MSAFAITFDSPPQSPKVDKQKLDRNNKVPKKQHKKQPNVEQEKVTVDSAIDEPIIETPVKANPSSKDEGLLSSLNSTERKIKESVEELRQIKNILDNVLVRIEVDIKQVGTPDSAEKINGLQSRVQENINIADNKFKEMTTLLLTIKQIQEGVSTVSVDERGEIYTRSIAAQAVESENLNQQIVELSSNIKKAGQHISDIKIAYEKEQQEKLEQKRKKERLEGIRAQKLGDIQRINQQNVALIGKNVRDCPVCPQMVVVPAGHFVMGNKEGQGKADEQPQHDVFISIPFMVSVFEITFEEWDTCVTEGGCSDNKTNDGGWGRAKRPVIFISWNDAKSYVKWLSRKTSKHYRLLSEAEWEYMARGNSNTKYWWGEQHLSNMANCDGCGSVYDNKKTAPVGSFPALNKFGIADVLGNVYEWVEDCYTNNYNDASVVGAAFISQCDEGRVLRGGSWSTSYEKIRSTARKKASPITQMDDYGIRVARDL